MFLDDASAGDFPTTVKRKSTKEKKEKRKEKQQGITKKTGPDRGRWEGRGYQIVTCVVAI